MRADCSSARQGEKRSMRHTRVIVTHYGGPDALRVIEEECPEPRNGEVRVRVLAAGVSLPDLLMREGVHPETRPVPFTPGWDVIGVVDRLGAGTSGIEPGQIVAALPISGAYAEFVCLPQRELVPVPAGLDAAEAVSLVLNYVTAFQMLHRSANVRPGQRALIHGAAGGVGSALVQLGRLAGLEMYGTCSSRGASAVSDLGAIPIDYQHLDFVKGSDRRSLIKKGHVYRIVVSDLSRHRRSGSAGRIAPRRAWISSTPGSGRKTGRLRLAVMDMGSLSPLDGAPHRRQHLFDKFHVCGTWATPRSGRKREYAGSRGDSAGSSRGRSTPAGHRENLTLDGRRASRRCGGNKRLHTAYLLKESFGQLWDYGGKAGRAASSSTGGRLKWQRLEPTRSSPR